MVVNRKKLRNRIFKISFSFVIAALIIVLGLFVRSNAKAAVVNPGTIETNNKLFTYSNDLYSACITATSFSKDNSGVNTSIPLFSQLSLNNTASLFYNYNHITNYSGNVNYLLSNINQVFTYSNDWSYVGGYFSSKYFFNQSTDSYSVNNTTYFNHFRMYINVDDVYCYFSFNSNEPDTKLYILPLIKDSGCYTFVNSSHQYSFIYPDIDWDNDLFTIDTGINIIDRFVDVDGDEVAVFNSNLVNGITLDYYFYKPLEYSTYNNFLGLAYRGCFNEFYDSCNFHFTSYLDFVPIDFDGSYADGYSVGYNNGFNNGVDSINSSEIYNNGYNAGYTSGQNSVDVNAIAQNNYTSGYNAGLLASSHDYGIKDLLYSIFDVPINVLSNLFSFTIFGSNVWVIIVSLLTILVVIWIVSKVLGIVFGGGGKK